MLQKNLLKSLCLILFLPLVSCSSILTATFERDMVDNLPDRGLPGGPDGDQLRFNDGLRVGLKVTSEALSGTKALEFKNRYDADGSAHSRWLNFDAQSTDLNKPISFLWSGKIKYFGDAEVLADCSFRSANNNAIPIVRLTFDRENQLSVLPMNYAINATPIAVGQVDRDLTHTVTVTLDLSRRKFTVNLFAQNRAMRTVEGDILIPISDINRSSNRPTLSFTFDNRTNSPSAVDAKYIIDDVDISKARD
jgi:hypothetical protein